MREANENDGPTGTGGVRRTYSTVMRYFVKSNAGSGGKLRGEGRGRGDSFNCFSCQQLDQFRRLNPEGGIDLPDGGCGESVTGVEVFGD